MLRNIEITQAKARSTVYKIADQGGLFLEVRPTGAKYWRYRYRIDGRENAFSIGEYGDRPNQFTLAAARLARDEAAKLVAQNLHPRAQKKGELAARLLENRNTFAAISAEWLETKAGKVTPHYFAQLRTALDRDINPVIGSTVASSGETPRALDPAGSRLRAGMGKDAAPRRLRGVRLRDHDAARRH